MASMALSCTPSDLSRSTPATTISGQEVENPTIQFTTIEALLQEIRRVQGDFCIVRDVSPQDFLALLQYEETHKIGCRLRRYYPETKTLIVTVPTHVHERLHRVLDGQLRTDKLAPMNGLHKDWNAQGSATYWSQGHPGGAGEGDSCGGPKSVRGRPGDWPTLVIEAGVSESLSQLRMDMGWWFAASNHEVKIVILAKFDHGQQRIILEKYEEEMAADRPGATTTRHATISRPVLKQNISIARQGTNPPAYTVVRAPLVLSFRLLFLRDPRPGESDVVFDIADLEDYAVDVWQQVQPS